MISVATVLKLLASRLAGWLVAAGLSALFYIVAGHYSAALKVERAAVARLEAEARVRVAADVEAAAAAKATAEADAANAAAEPDLQRAIDNAPLVAQCTSDDFMRRLRNVR